jgi:hypothetical protein
MESGTERLMIVAMLQEDMRLAAAARRAAAVSRERTAPDRPRRRLLRRAPVARHEPQP